MEFLYRPPDVGRTILTSLSSTSMQTLRHTQKKLESPTPIEYGGNKLIKLEFKYLIDDSQNKGKFFKNSNYEPI